MFKISFDYYKKQVFFIRETLPLSILIKVYCLLCSNVDFYLIRVKELGFVEILLKTLEKKNSKKKLDVIFEILSILMHDKDFLKKYE